jgi:hypothetical protein
VIAFLNGAVSDPVPLRMFSVIEEHNDNLVWLQPFPLRISDLEPGESREEMAHLTLYGAPR